MEFPLTKREDFCRFPLSAASVLHVFHIPAVCCGSNLLQLNPFHTKVAPIFGSHPVCAEPATIWHLWFDPLKTHKTRSAAKVKRTTPTLYFSSTKA